MALMGYFLCLGVSLFIITVLWRIKRSHYRQLGSKIPGPPGIPLLGNMFDVFAARKDVMGHLRELRSRYGTVVKVWLGSHLMVMLTNPQDISVIFSSSKTLSKPVFYKPLGTVFGSSLVAAECGLWKKHRKIMEPTFTHHVIDEYVDKFYEKSRLMADLLEEHSDEQPFNVFGYTIRCFLEMVGETSLDIPLSIQDRNSEPSVFHNLPKIMKIVTYLLLTPWFWFTYTLKFTRSSRRVFELIKPIRNFVDETVQMKINSCANSPVSKNEYGLCKHGAKKKLGFLEQMISTMINSPGDLTAEELRDEVLFVMSAGSDTSANTVLHVLMLLGLDEEVQRKVLKEQEYIFGEDMHRPITKRDLREMVYLEQVINETMRLYPTVPFVGRLVCEDIRISDYVIPAATTVAIPIFLVHRDPAYFPEPYKFDPDRFKKENIRSLPACSFIPFASGHRMCLGRYYAYMAMKTVLSVLLRRYEVQTCCSREDMECVQFHFLLKMVNSRNIKLRSRETLRLS